MRPRSLAILGSVLLAPLVLVSSPVTAQRGGMFQGSANDPAIGYSTAPLDNVVVDVNRKLQAGAVQLKFDGRSGFLQSALDALDISVDSQVLVFSRTSLQAKRINQANPRALFFNDRVALGWVRDGEVIEVAAHDARQGMVFYELDQKPPADASTEQPQFRRDFKCLGCHMAGDTLGVPGLLMFSTTSPPGGGFARSVMMDHRMRSTRATGRWFVTGSSGAATIRQRSGGDCRPGAARGAIGRGAVRPRRLPRDVERHRRPASAVAPGPHDEPADPHRLGGARRRIRRCTRRSWRRQARMSGSGR